MKNLPYKEIEKYTKPFDEEGTGYSFKERLGTLKKQIDTLRDTDGKLSDKLSHRDLYDALSGARK